MVLLIVAAVILLPIVFVLLISYLRHLKYTDKKFTNSLLNTVLYPIKWLKIGPYSHGKLTLEKAMKFAMKVTKLSDYGDMGFVKAYETVTNSPAQKSFTLSNIGYLMHRNELDFTMAKKLRAVQYIKENPDVLKIPVRSPVFVLGLPRTGTTFLHRLLSLDPAVRAPLLWELMNPVPRVTGPTDTMQQDLFDADMNKRAKFCRKQLKVRDALGDDSLKHIHEIDADLPEECLIALAEDIPVHLSYLCTLYLEFDAIFPNTDMINQVVHAYTMYKRTLQMLTYQYIGQRQDPSRWVLKCPLHLFYIKEIAKVFPDAKIIWTHRHPVSAIPSMCSLLKSIHEVYYEAETRNDALLGKAVRDVSGDNLLSAVQDIEDTGLGHSHIVYNNLVKDPIGTVKAIYAEHQWVFSKEYEEILTQYLSKDKLKREDAKKNKLQANDSVLHHYTPEEFSLTYDELSTGNFDKYVKMFNIPMSKN